QPRSYSRVSRVRPRRDRRTGEPRHTDRANGWHLSRPVRTSEDGVRSHRGARVVAIDVTGIKMTEATRKDAGVSWLWVMGSRTAQSGRATKGLTEHTRRLAMPVAAACPMCEAGPHATRVPLPSARCFNLVKDHELL